MRVRNTLYGRVLQERHTCHHSVVAAGYCVVRATRWFVLGCSVTCQLQFSDFLPSRHFDIARQCNTTRFYEHFDRSCKDYCLACPGLQVHRYTCVQLCASGRSSMRPVKENKPVQYVHAFIRCTPKASGDLRGPNFSSAPCSFLTHSPHQTLPGTELHCHSFSQPTPCPARHTCSCCTR